MGTQDLTKAFSPTDLWLILMKIYNNYSALRYKYNVSTLYEGIKENKTMSSWKSKGYHYPTLSLPCEKWSQIGVHLVLVAFSAGRINLSPWATLWKDDHLVSEEIYLPLPWFREKLLLYRFPLPFAADNTPLWISVATQYQDLWVQIMLLALPWIRHIYHSHA